MDKDTVDKKKKKKKNVKTYGITPAVHTIIPKHPTDPETFTHEKPIDN